MNRSCSCFFNFYFRIWWISVIAQRHEQVKNGKNRLFTPGPRHRGRRTSYCRRRVNATVDRPFCSHCHRSPRQEPLFSRNERRQSAGDRGWRLAAAKHLRTILRAVRLHPYVLRCVLLGCFERNSLRFNFLRPDFRLCTDTAYEQSESFILLPLSRLAANTTQVVSEEVLPRSDWLGGGVDDWSGTLCARQ